MSNQNKRIKKWTILGLSIIAAAWMIAGPAWLAKLGLQSEKLIELLTFMPAFGVMFMIVIAPPGSCCL